MIKNKKSVSRANLFLIELIIIITFFIVSLTIIMRIFSEANTLSIDSSALNGASITMQTNAEEYKLLEYENLKSDIQVIYYDKNWNTCDKDNAYYMITVEISLEDNKHSVIATFNQNANFVNNKHIFSLETKKLFKKDVDS